ncbi:MAG: hypothetical protein WCX48_08020 [Bacteroidales bacterium]|jgi:hypothetical protein
MKVGLNVLERVMLLSVLPKEGNFTTLRLTRELQAKIGISAAEYKEFEVQTDEKGSRWNIKGAAPTEIEFADAEIDIIKKQLKELDSKNKLTNDLFSVYEKFVN